MKKISAKNINRQLKAMEQHFETHIGHYAKIRQRYPQILRPQGLVKGGTGLVMSYNEAYKRMRKGVSEEIEIDFSKETYQNIVESFYYEQMTHLYYKTEYKIQRERAEAIIIDAYQREGVDIPDLSKFTLYELKKTIREANVFYNDSEKLDKTDSPKFYERVIRNLNEIAGNGDAETQ